MKSLSTYIMYVCVLCLALPMHAQVKGNKVPTAEEMLNVSAQGRLFWLAIPPNEALSQNAPTRALEIYVTSSFDTEVTLEVPGLGVPPRTKKVNALDITTFTDAAAGGGEMTWAYEVRESESPSQLGIKLTSPDPISVYVLTAKLYTSEGYLALPVDTWGREYIHLSYYDYPEMNVNRGGGFIIIAHEDDTEVNFRLAGTMVNGRTLGGRRIGDPYRVVLQEGETYMVQGDGSDRNFDISGTRISATKTIGLISFHMRTIIPSALGVSSRDNLIEMPPPISTWGKNYVSLELRRANRGDYFRIVAAEDQTEFEAVSYDLQTKEVLSRRQGLLSAGQTAQFEETLPTANTESIRGTTVWKANKPVLVMQYAYSSGWDGMTDFDPFMVLVVPQEQYIPATVFQTPSRADFNTNWFNIIAEGDTTDPTHARLKSLELDGNAIWKSMPQFLANRIPNTQLYWARINVNPGAHRVKGDTRFGGYIYGFSQFESYGWPAAMALNKIDELDTIPPTIEIEDKCGIFDIESTELVVAPASDDPRQIDQGIAAIDLIEGEDKANPISYNVGLEFLTAKELAVDPKLVRFSYRIKVLDLSEDARAIFAVVDRAGNRSIDTVEYIAEVVTLEPNPIDFGKLRLGRTKHLAAELVNPKNRVIELKSFSIGAGLYFRLVDPPQLAAASEDAPFRMEAFQRVPIIIEYEPQIETSDLEDPAAIDRDSVFAQTSCREFALAELRGRGVMPHIRVADFDAGIQSKGRRVCEDTKGSEGIFVENVGTDTLTITGFNYDAAKAVFEFEGGAPVAVPGRPTANPPWVLKPGASMVLQRLCFRSDETDVFSFDIELESDTDPKDEEAGRHISRWRGGTIESGPFRGNYSFAPLRVGTHSREGLVELMNFGRDRVTLHGIREFRNSSGFFRLIAAYRKSVGAAENLLDQWQLSQDRGETPPRPGIPLDGIDPDTPAEDRDPNNIVVVRVEYSPTGLPEGEGSHRAQIVPLFVDELGKEVPEADIAGSGEVLGSATIPRISAVGYDFRTIRCGETSEETGRVTISNPSRSEALHIYGVEFRNEALPPAERPYTWLGPNPLVSGGVVQPFDIPIGESRSLQVAFKAVGASSFDVPVRIFSDAHEGEAGLVDPTETVVEITGRCIDGDVMIEDLAFGDLLLCDTETGLVRLTNSNQSDVEILDIQLAGDSPEQFRILDDPQQDQLLIPADGGSYAIRVEYSPTRPGSFNAIVRVFTDQRAEPYEALLSGDAHEVNLSFDLENLDRPATPGDVVNLDLTLAGDDATVYDDIVEAEVSGLDVELSYKLSAVKLIGFDSDDASWDDLGRADFTSVQSADGIETISFTVSGAPIDAAGLIGAARFRVFLSAEEEIDIRMDVEVLSEQRRECVNHATTPGSILMDPVCLNHNRLFTLSGTGFALRTVAPNPVTGARVRIEYSLGFSAHTSLLLYNAMGEVVDVLVDQVQREGAHAIGLNSAGLPSGVYTCRIASGPFHQSQIIVISK